MPLHSESVIVRFFLEVVSNRAAVDHCQLCQLVDIWNFPVTLPLQCVSVALLPQCFIYYVSQLVLLPTIYFSCTTTTMFQPLCVSVVLLHTIYFSCTTTTMFGRKRAPCQTGLDLCRPLLRCSHSLFVDKKITFNLQLNKYGWS